MRYDNYGFGDENWNLSGIIKTEDPRKSYCLMILDSRHTNGEVSEADKIVGPDGNPITFKLLVLSRFACEMDKDGNRIFRSKEAKDRSGQSSDIVANPGDKPRPGDVITFKIGFKTRNSDGLEMKDVELMSMAEDGQDIYDRRKLVVDSDLCITLPNPYAMMALRRHGERMIFPEFSVQYRPRKVTNWWFREVPKSYTTKVIEEQTIDSSSKGKK